MSTILGIFADDLYNDTDSTHLYDTLLACHREKQLIQKEFKYSLKTTGKEKWIRGTWVFQEPDTVMLHTEDITGQKRALAALEQSEKRLKLSTRYGRIGLWELNLSDRRAWRSLEHDEIFGYDTLLPEWTYDRFLSHVVKDDRQAVEQKFGQALQSLTPWDVECRITTKTGDLRWIHARGLPETCENHQPIKMYGVVQDITERKKRESALKENEDRYKSAQRMGKVGNWEYDLQTEHFWGSEQAKRIYGFAPDSDRFTTDEVENCIPERQRVHQALVDLIEKDIPYNLEFDIHPVSGPKNRRIRSIAELQRDENGLPLKVTGVIQDITEQKKALEAKEKLEKQLRQAQKIDSIGKLAGGIAHDFNNILYPIIGFTQLSKDELPKNHPVQENLTDILDGAKRARDLVKRILLFSRQEDQTLTPTSLKPVIEETLKLLRSSTPANVQIQSRLYDGEACVLCDATHIHEIVMNLCTNASHALEDQGGTIDIALDLVTPDAGLNLMAREYLCLKISDSGTGIPESLLESIFDPYFTTKAVGKGSGLGLSVVHGIVKNYQGEITATSEPGKGTVFTVYLPVTESRPFPLQDQNSKDMLSGSERILFVDDEASIVKLAVRALERQGYEISGEQNSTKALDRIKNRPHHFDLVITDMAMPTLDGMQLAEKIFALNPAIPILICSGYSKKLDQTTVDIPNIKAKLDKPLQIEELIIKTRQILDHKKEEK